MTKLVMHYAPGGVLAVLKREPCPGQKGKYGGIQHSFCGCDKNHQVYTIVNVTVLEADEAEWCLEQSWINRQLAENEVMMQKGDSYYDDHGLLITITRVSKSKSWADIEVFARTGASWTKRQPLVDGKFAFAVRRVAE